MLINTQTIKLCCDAEGCDSVIVQCDNSLVYHNADPVRAWIPSEWTQVKNLLFCPKHELHLLVDGVKSIPINRSSTK